MDAEATTQTEFLTLPFEYAPKRTKGVGLVAPFDFALDDEVWRWMPKNVPLYVSRTPRLENTAVTAMLATDVSEAAAVIPAIRSLISADPAVVAYACTSGSFVGGARGEEELRTIMRNGGASDAVTTSGALLEALRALNVTKLSIATPYNEELTQLLVRFLHDNGMQVVKAGYLNTEHDIMHITEGSVEKMADKVDDPEAEVVFFSCTNLRTFDIISSMEARLGKPVISANQVTIWSALRHAQLPLPGVEQRLFMV